MSASRFFRRCLVSAVLAAPAFLSGCACMNPDNLPLFGLVRDHLTPDSEGARVAAMPLLAPAAAGACVLDALILHPVDVTGDAAADTRELFWGFLEWEPAETIVFPLRLLATPPYFVGNVLGRSLFDIPPRAALGRRQARARAVLLQARQFYDDGRTSETLDTLGSIDIDALPDADRHACYLLQVQSAALSGLYSQFPYHGARELLGTPARPAVFDALRQMIRRSSALQRWKAYDLYLNLLETDAEKLALFEEIQKEDDPVMRHRALQWLDLRNYALPAGALWIPALDRVAARDPNAMNRVLALQAAARIRLTRTPR